VSQRPAPRAPSASLAAPPRAPLAGVPRRARSARAQLRSRAPSLCVTARARRRAAAAGTPVVDTVWKAAAYGDLPCLRALLAKEPRLAEARDGAGFSPLQWAALNDRVDVVEALLALRVDPDRRAARPAAACAAAAPRAPHAARARLRGARRHAAGCGGGTTHGHVRAAPRARAQKCSCMQRTVYAPSHLTAWAPTSPAGMSAAGSPRSQHPRA